MPPHADLFPPLEPFETGMLAEAGHAIYWEVCGNPQGQPALFLHGGPGAGCSATDRCWFDPAIFRIVLFDQRGSGRSRPLASDPTADLSTNTTPLIIQDMEKLREYLRIESWTLLGLSWGTTLALCYAQAHPKRVDGLVLGSVTTTSASEVEWITRHVGRIFPIEWDRFTKAIPASLRHLPICDAYATLLFDSEPSVRDQAAREWCAWEDAHISLSPNFKPSPRYQDPEFRLRFARLVTHYWRHAAFLGKSQLLGNAQLLDGIPGVLIHGRYDVSSPLDTAWQLHRQWKSSRLEVIQDAGHGSSDNFKRILLEAVAGMVK